jgi:hypothetical protein
MTSFTCILIIFKNLQVLPIWAYFNAFIASFQSRGLENLEVLRELLPAMPNIATCVLPEIINRLSSRVLAHLLRELVT